MFRVLCVKLKVFRRVFPINFVPVTVELIVMIENSQRPPRDMFDELSFAFQAGSFTIIQGICDELISVILLIYCLGGNLPCFSARDTSGRWRKKKLFFLNSHFGVLNTTKMKTENKNLPTHSSHEFASTSPVQFNFLLGESFRDEDGGGKFRYFSVFLAPVKHKFDIREKCCLSQVASAAASVGVMTK